MKVFAVILSVVLIAGWWFVEWQVRLEELSVLREDFRQRQVRLESGLSAELGRVPELEKRVEAQLAETRKLEGELKLEPDPPLAKLKTHLESEWKPLLRRPGLSASLTSLEAAGVTEPFVLGKLKAEGPKDEVFRLLDGLLRSARPSQLRQLEFKCDQNRAQATFELALYHR